METFKDIFRSLHRSTNTHRKVRLKHNTLNRLRLVTFSYVIIYSLFLISSISCLESRNNRPPRFLIDNNHSEIVLRLKEGPDTPAGSLIYKLKGLDPDGDALVFGVHSTFDSDILKIENLDNNEANIYLVKELDRETKDEYTIILTLTDNKLGEGNFVTQSLLLLVEDVNDSEPIFSSYQTALEVPENSNTGVLTTVEATDRDEGAYGQVVYYLEELDGDNDVFAISTVHGKGVIRLTKSLDYERKSLYQLRVLAIDRAHQGRTNTGTAAIVVKVKDLEDNGPEFIVASPVTRISENIPKGSIVTKVRAVDGDRGVNNKIKYSIIRGGNNMFKINEDTGVVTTIKTLDREDSRNLINGAYILEILAVEKSKINPAPSVTTEITIILTDENDSTPTFKSKKYECEIPENSQQSTPVNFLQIDAFNEVFDYDLGNNGTFELYLDPPNDIFDISPRRSLNEATFVVKVRNPKLLDYEKLKVLNFSIIAKEITADGKWSSVPLIIYIRDRNDNLPVFTKATYNIEVPENIGVGVSIAKIQATDMDSGKFGTQGIRYTNLAGSISQLLNLDSISGIITIKKSGGNFFDRELFEKHYLTVEARDDLGEGNRNTVPLIISLEDINDNPPIFLQRKYETRLFENRRLFETTLQVEARDADLNGTRNSEIFYEIIEGEFKKNFTIDQNTGFIKLRGVIDFEQLPRSQKSSIRPIHLTVQAIDGGSPPLMNQVSVVIYVQDENDYIPTFERSAYVASISEDLQGATSVLTVRAYDHDGSAPNNAIFYRIISGASDKFVIGSDTGVISVANGASLDPDLSDPKRTTYFLNVIALDGGIGEQQLSSTCTVNITIMDINNKSPIFNDLEMIYIKENTPVGTYVYRLIANDMDNEPMLRYFFDSESSEARTENGVIIKQSEYDYMSAFDLNPVDGLIRIVKILDREKVEMIKIGVMVEDIASVEGKQIDTEIITILIEDVNDNNPRFQKPFYRKSITENSQLGVIILNVIAYDVDKNKSLSYAIDGPDEITNLVHLDAESGEIIVRERIDHETFQWLNFTVRATDSGYPPRSSLVDVFIQVIDENDNNPYFITETQNLTISENQPIGSQIAVIEAGDADAGDFGKITFLIDRISSHGKFSIDPQSGVLSIADKIDREVKSSYMIVIEIWDNYQFGALSGESRNAFKQFNIKITDENDNPPIVQVPKECVSITEFHDIKEIVTTLRATDADETSTANGQVKFDIKGGTAADYFVIKQTDHWNANIFARHKLNGLYGNHSLEIVARDLGVPANFVEIKLDICIQDYNDHAPVFISPINNFTIRVAENATIGQNIVQVIAKDDDVGQNALIRYRLKHDLFGNYKTFSIDENTGYLSVNQSLNRDKQKLYEIRVEAYDQGIPKELSSDLDIIIYVHSINNYEPTFLVQSISVNFTEHVNPGNEKRKLPDTVARDEVDDLADEPTTVCYFIVEGNEDDLFHLDPITHTLSVLQELDREVHVNHTLVIKATEDCLNPPPTLNETITSHRKSMNSRLRSPKSDFDPSMHPMNILMFELENEPAEALETPELFDDNNILISEDSTLVQVIVLVQDINDNPPRFVSRTFTGGVATSADFGSELMQIKAVDKDIGLNSKMSYYQVGSTHRTLAEGLDNVQNPPFIIEKDTGSIQLNFDPQKGMKGYFDFTVFVNDTGGYNDTAHVFIYLLREDQRLKIVLRQQHFEFREKIDLFRRTFSNVTNAIVNIDDFKVHENKDGTVDRTKTDLYLHLVDKKDNSIIEVTDVLRMVDKNIEKLDDLFKQFNVLDTQPSEALLYSAEFGNPQMIIWLVMVNLIMGALLIVVVTLCLSQRTNYRRELKAARVDAFGSTDNGRIPITARVPNTNKHSIEGSNPIWLKAYENEWYKNDDSFSHRSDGHDSLDENVLVNDSDVDPNKNGELYIKNTSLSKEFNGLNTQNNLIKHFNVYQQIDKMTNGTILAKKLETTEL